MTTYLLGQLLEVKPIEMQDKKTQKTIYSTDITVLFEGIDEEGYKKVSAETINVDETMYDSLKEFIGKYVAIAYRTINAKSGTYTFPDNTMPVMTMEKSPLDFTPFKRTSPKK